MEQYRRLTRRDRYQIEKHLARGKSVRWIADRLGFHRSSIYREKRRGTITVGVTGGKKRGEYSAIKAHRDFLSTESSARRGFLYRGWKIKGWVEDQIRIKISKGWSPEQISKRLLIEKNISISPEGIYKFIFSCKKRNETLHKFLRRYGGRRKRFQKRNRYWELQPRRRKSIDSRPEEANQRSEIGHWERDLMLGRRKTGALLTMVDRKTHFTILKKLKTTFAHRTNLATAELIRKSKLPCKTITNDNGHEFGEFWNLEKMLEAPVYFTHPLSPWERGTVENTIGLIRQFIPKGVSLKKISHRDVEMIQDELNSRPRKKLGYRTPYEMVTGKKQNLFKQKKIAPLPAEYYEQFYLTAEEIEEKNYD